jgi:hypothetical protein
MTTEEKPLSRYFRDITANPLPSVKKKNPDNAVFLQCALEIFNGNLSSLAIIKIKIEAHTKRHPARKNGGSSFTTTLFAMKVEPQMM